MSAPQPPNPGEQAWSEAGPSYPPAQQYYGPPPPQPPQPPLGPGGPGYPPPPPESKTPAWAWVLLGVVIVALLGGLGYFAVTQLTGSNNVPAATAPPHATPTAPPAVTPSAKPTPSTAATSTTGAPSTTPQSPVTVPASAKSCRPAMQTAEFSTSAVTGATSCPFAEEVRIAYLQQPERDASVSVRAWSPTTGEWYTMSCAGGDVVRCTGGDGATVYVY